MSLTTPFFSVHEAHAALPSRVRLREGLLVAGCYVLLLWAIWSPPRRQIVVGAVALLSMVVVTFLRRLPMRQLGLDLGAFRRGAWIVVAAACVATGMVLLSAAFGTLQPLASNTTVLLRTSLYLVWALEQQFMLQSFLFVGVERALGTRIAVLACAGLFGFAHLPNPVLTLATLAAGVLFTLAFARYRNVYLLAVAHLILGLAFAVAVPEEVHHHMRVGWGYSRYVPK